MMRQYQNPLFYIGRISYIYLFCLRSLYFYISQWQRTTRVCESRAFLTLFGSRAAKCVFLVYIRGPENSQDLIFFCLKSEVCVLPFGVWEFLCLCKCTVTFHTVHRSLYYFFCTLLLFHTQSHKKYLLFLVYCRSQYIFFLSFSEK